MKRDHIIAISILLLGWAASTAHAEWGFMTTAHDAELGYGLIQECNSLFVPQSQQTGIECSPHVAEKPQPPVQKVEVKPEPVKPQAVAATPAPEPAKAVPQKEWRLTGVKFETGSDKLKPESQSALNEAADILKAHPRVVVEIQGHTDNVGNDNANANLSEKRAFAVKKYLTDHGIGTERLAAKGYGESAPIADNNTSEGRAENRRIEFKILNQ